MWDRSAGIDCSNNCGSGVVLYVIVVLVQGIGETTLISRISLEEVKFVQIKVLVLVWYQQF